MLYRHKGRRTTYRVLHEDARMQCSKVRQLDDEPMVVYQNVVDGKVGVRPVDEFYDGRFELLPDPAEQRRPRSAAVLADVLAGCNKLASASRDGEDPDKYDVDDLFNYDEVMRIVAALRIMDIIKKAIDS